MFKVGDRVRFSKRCQPAQWMTIVEVNDAPLLGHTLYKLNVVTGWWVEGNLTQYC